jgi:FAD/FMN-containing dehydrogenase
MQKTTSLPRRRRWLVVLLLVASLLLAAAKKFFDYSAAPAGEKESDFVYPPNADQTKPTTLVFEVPAPRQLPFEQIGGYINDASHLNKTAVYGIVKVTSVEDIQYAVQFARDHKLKVTAAGSRHSMGGHTFVKDGLVLDMRGFNQVRLDKEHKILNVQSGATWKQLQLFLDPQGLSVKAMQSINIFTVGGTLSVNAHGIAHHPGQVAPTVRSFRILESNGEIKNCSPAENSELFRHALGGYGLMGIILDVDLDVVENEMYIWKTHYMDYKDFAAYYQRNVDGNPGIGLAYGRLSMSPATFLSETAMHTYEKAHTEVPVVPLKLPGYVWLDRFIINFSKTGDFGRRVRWTMEKYGEPRVHNCLSRNEAMSREEGCFVSRNQEMYDSMDYLENRLKDTDILQEYFIPREKMEQFVDGLRSIVRGTGPI